MIELWIPLTVAAAFLQNIRSALQKHLKGDLGTAGATFVRFAYGFPLAIAYVAGLALLSGQPLPRPDAAFALYVVVGGIAQIVATALLVSLFSLRNFAVGTTYSKTETVQTALFGIVILGERPSPGALLGIVIGLIGVMVISVAKGATARGVWLAWTSRPALIGLASGAAFGIAAVSYRAASLSLAAGGVFLRAGFTLACVTVLQTAIMALYIRIREPGQLSRVAAAWRTAIWVGVAGVAASIGWFTAMTLENAAYVRALGQIELVFTVIASVVIFREHASRTEAAGIALVIAGILVLILLR